MFTPMSERNNNKKRENLVATNDEQKALFNRHNSVQTFNKVNKHKQRSREYTLKEKN